MFKKFLTTIILSMLVVSSVFAQPPTPPSENGYAPMPPTHRHRKMPRGDIYGLCRMAGINLSEQQINLKSLIANQLLLYFTIRITNSEYQIFSIHNIENF